MATFDPALSYRPKMAAAAAGGGSHVCVSMRPLVGTHRDVPPAHPTPPRDAGSSSYSGPTGNSPVLLRGKGGSRPFSYQDARWRHRSSTCSDSDDSMSSSSYYEPFNRSSSSSYYDPSCRNSWSHEPLSGKLSGGSEGKGRDSMLYPWSAKDSNSNKEAWSSVSGPYSSSPASNSPASYSPAPHCPTSHSPASNSPAHQGAWSRSSTPQRELRRTSSSSSVKSNSSVKDMIRIFDSTEDLTNQSPTVQRRRSQKLIRQRPDRVGVDPKRLSLQENVDIGDCKMPPVSSDKAPPVPKVKTGNGIAGHVGNALGYTNEIRVNIFHGKPVLDKVTVGPKDNVTEEVICTSFTEAGLQQVPPSYSHKVHGPVPIRSTRNIYAESQGKPEVHTSSYNIENNHNTNIGRHTGLNNIGDPSGRTDKFPTRTTERGVATSYDIENNPNTNIGRNIGYNEIGGPSDRTDKCPANKIEGGVANSVIDTCPTHATKRGVANGEHGLLQRQETYVVRQEYQVTPPPETEVKTS